MTKNLQHTSCSENWHTDIFKEHYKPVLLMPGPTVPRLTATRSW